MDSILHAMGHAVEHAFVDSFAVLPFLFLVYLVINYLEGSSNQARYNKLIGKKGIGPIIGSLVGCLPQCGFSVMGANLYSKRLISLGTLLAIFISTSDEAVPILLANPGMMKQVIAVLVIKVVLAIVIGVIIDFVISQKNEDHDISKEEMNHACTCHDGCCSTKGNIIKRTLVHTLKVFAFIVVVNMILGGIIEIVGEDSLGKILLANSIWQPALAALIGLVPNCAASIVLTEMFVAGSLSFGALIAGLSTGAGIGLVVLFRVNKNLKENLKVLGLLYVLGTVFGMLIQIFIG